MRNMGVMIMLCGFLVSCGKGVNEGAEALASFKAYVAKELPGTEFSKKVDDGSTFTSSCTFTQVDVKKTDQVASPWKGIVRGSGLLTGPLTIGSDYDLVFVRDAKGAWTCSDADSKVNVRTSGPTTIPCGMAEANCRGH